MVEDELLHAENTKLCIEEAGFHVAGESAHADEALEAILQVKPHVVLMDISLPGKHNGITLARALREKSGVPIIFTTSFHDTATIQEAAQANPVSYLVKPIQTENLKAAVTLAMSVEPKTEEGVIAENGAIFIKSGNRLQKILIDDVLWIESAGDNYCKLVTEEHQLVSRYTLKAMVSQLNSTVFVQAHRAYVVNKHKIESIHEKDQVIFINKYEIPIGRSYKEDLYQQLRRL